MKNEKIIISTTISILLIVGGFFLLSGKNTTQYGYEIMSQTGGTNDKNINININSVATGVIANPVSPTALAYINTWNGDVKITQKGATSSITTKIQFTEGDTLITGKDANAEIVFADNSIVRMNAHSKLSFVKLASAGSEVRLNEGDIWARVLKPFYDASFFTISTSDVSAGVQGTSVRIRKTLTGTTNIAVIDSYSQNTGKEGVILRYNKKNSKELSEQILKPENEFTYTASGDTTVTNSLPAKIALSDSFIRENTKRDLIYINNLTKEKGDNENLMKRLKGELSVTLPKSDEISVFFDEPILQKIALVSSGSVPTINLGTQKDPVNSQILETFMNDVQKDVSLMDNRRDIVNIKHKINTPSFDKEEKKQIEKILLEKEQKIEIDIREIQEKQKNIESNNENKVNSLPVSEVVNPVKTKITSTSSIIKQKESQKVLPKENGNKEKVQNIVSKGELKKDSPIDISARNNFIDEVKQIVLSQGGTGSSIYLGMTSDDKKRILEEMKYVISKNSDKIGTSFRSATGTSDDKKRILEEMKNVISKHIIAPLIPLKPSSVDLKLEESASAVNTGGPTYVGGGGVGIVAPPPPPAPIAAPSHSSRHHD